MNKEIYISLDVEADGPVPGLYSMLSLGAVAFMESESPDGYDILHKFDTTFEPLPDAKRHPETMQWWAKQSKEAWETATKNPGKPKHVMTLFRTWLSNLEIAYSAPLVAVGYPASFDFSFVHYYGMRFLKEYVLGYSCIDIESYAMQAYGIPYSDMKEDVMATLSPQLFEGLSENYSHKAVEDAKRQGIIFMRMLTGKG